MKWIQGQDVNHPQIMKTVDVEDFGNVKSSLLPYIKKKLSRDCPEQSRSMMSAVTRGHT